MLLNCQKKKKCFWKTKFEKHHLVKLSTKINTDIIHKHINQLILFLNQLYCVRIRYFIFIHLYQYRIKLFIGKFYKEKKLKFRNHNLRKKIIIFNQ